DHHLGSQWLAAGCQPFCKIDHPFFHDHKYGPRDQNGEKNTQTHNKQVAPLPGQWKNPVDKRTDDPMEQVYRIADLTKEREERNVWSRARDRSNENNRREP
ncbi:hypothetical protein LZC13_10715, partial [Campylobacter coli]|nr:hypothetical protein [Campylobacter coli]